MTLKVLSLTTLLKWLLVLFTIHLAFLLVNLWFQVFLTNGNMFFIYYIIYYISFISHTFFYEWVIWNAWNISHSFHLCFLGMFVFCDFFADFFKIFFFLAIKIWWSAMTISRRNRSMVFSFLMHLSKAFSFLRQRFLKWCPKNNMTGAMY